MKPNSTGQKLRAVGLSLLLVITVATMTVTLSGSAAAAANAGTISVSQTPASSGSTITVTGDATSTDDLTFLIEDSSDGDYAIYTRSISSRSYSVDITLNDDDFNGDGLDGSQAVIRVDQNSGFASAEDSTTFQVDDEYPSVSIDGPADGASLTSGATLEGTASDNLALSSVQVAIRRSNGDYYQGSSSWGSSRNWLDASGTSDWSYDATALTGDTYTVFVRAEDTAGNVRSYYSGPSSTDLRTTYSVDGGAPSVSAVDVTHQASDDTVSVDDTVAISADVTDSTGGVDTVTVNASQLGGSNSLELTTVSGDSDTYSASFDVASPSVGDGPVDLTVTATDTHGNSATGSDTVTYDPEIASVDSLTIDQEFVGFVHDTNQSIRVTATGVQDAQGYAIAGGDGSAETATLEIAGETYTVTVDDGEINYRMNPTSIPDSATPGPATVSLREANAQSATERVELVHEARDLASGYQVTGTPMDAQDVTFQYVNDAITYNPTATSDSERWVAPAENESGSGYYVSGINDSARIGYTFEAETDVRAVTLHEGYNLVAATPDINDGTTIDLNGDLGSGLDYVTDDNIEVYVRNPDTELSDPNGETDVAAYEVASDSESLTEYQGYFVYVDSGDATRVVEDEEYQATDGS